MRANEIHRVVCKQHRCCKSVRGWKYIPKCLYKALDKVIPEVNQAKKKSKWSYQI